MSAKKEMPPEALRLCIVQGRESLSEFCFRIVCRPPELDPASREPGRIVIESAGNDLGHPDDARPCQFGETIRFRLEHVAGP